jgi:hypothetical protein
MGAYSDAVDNLFKEAFSSKPDNNIVIYTGLQGYYEFQWAMLGVNGRLPKFFIYYSKKCNFWVLSLHEKHGMDKIIIYKRNLVKSDVIFRHCEFRRGTQVLGISNDVEDAGWYFGYDRDYNKFLERRYKELEADTRSGILYSQYKDSPLNLGKGILEQIRKTYDR